MIYCSLVRPRENPPLIGFSSLLLRRNNEIVIYLEPEPVSVQEHKYKCKYKVKYKNRYKYKYKDRKWPYAAHRAEVRSANSHYLVTIWCQS